MMPAARYKAGAARSSFARQRMDKSSSQSVAAGTNTKLTGFTSDGTYPATVTSNALVVAGGGLANITATVTASGGLSASSAELRKNGTSIGSVSLPTANGTRTITVNSHTLADGDQLTVWHIGTFNGNKTVTAAMVDVVPA
jgi:hypothetical protein